MTSFLLSLFQTPTGAWYWLSIWILIGWLFSTAVTGATLYLMRNERIEAAHTIQETQRKVHDLEESQSPWVFSKQQEEKFLSSLKDAPKGKLAIEYIRSDEKRSREFAVKIKNMLEASGYDVWGYMAGFQQADSPPLVGVQIGVKDQQSNVVAGGIQKAFRNVGISASLAQQSNNNYEDDRAVIFIGLKP